MHVEEAAAGRALGSRQSDAAEFNFDQAVAPGSKSEHEAVMIRTPEGETLLRRTGGNAFRDEVLPGLVGHRIRGTGQKIETAVILDDWELL